MTSWVGRFTLGDWCEGCASAGPQRNVRASAQLTYRDTNICQIKTPHLPHGHREGKHSFPSQAPVGWGWEPLSCLKFFGEEAGYKQMKGMVVSDPSGSLGSLRWV